MMTFCALGNMSDATQHHGLTGGGVGMMTFCALDNMSDATQHCHGVGMMTHSVHLTTCRMLRNIMG